jgi:hypothetical protein
VITIQITIKETPLGEASEMEVQASARGERCTAAEKSKADSIMQMIHDDAVASSKQVGNGVTLVNDPQNRLRREP